MNKNDNLIQLIYKIVQESNPDIHDEEVLFHLTQEMMAEAISLLEKDGTLKDAIDKLAYQDDKNEAVRIINAFLKFNNRTIQ